MAVKYRANERPERTAISELARGLAMLTAFVAPRECMAKPHTAPEVSPALSGFRSYPYASVKVQALRDSLRSGRLAAIPKTLFASNYDETLSDLIFYFEDTDSTSRVVLAQGSKAIRKLHSARYVWVLVFFEGNALKRSVDAIEVTTRPKSITLPKGAKVASGGTPDSSLAFDEMSDTSGASVRIEPLDFHRGVVEATVLGGLASILGRTIPETQTAAPKDDLQALTFTKLSDDKDKNPLYFGYVKFALQEKTVNRVRVALGEYRRGYATFPNYTASATGLSLAVMMRAPAEKATKWRNTTMESAVLFHLYAFRPELPHLKGVSGSAAFGVFAGLGLGSDVLKRPSVGIALDHVFGELGFVGGLSFHGETDSKKPDRWKTAYLFGLSYTL